MTTTPTTHETVSDESTTETPPTLFERPAPSYEYLGQDTENDNHHYDRATDTIHVAQHPLEQFHPDHTDEPWIRVRGPAHYTEHLDEYDDCGVPEWIDYVHTIRGWTDWPTTIHACRSPDHLTVELERPVTPGHVERAYCLLQDTLMARADEEMAHTSDKATTGMEADR